jgi:hypothetical protein
MNHIFILIDHRSSVIIDHILILIDQRSIMPTSMSTSIILTEHQIWSVVIIFQYVNYDFTE